MNPKPTAVVTAAGHGIGAAIARQLAADGYQLALLSNAGGAEALADELGGLGLTGSVAAAADLARLVERTLDTYGHIDAVVNNTGHPPKGDLLKITDEEWHRGLDLVLLNVVRMARLVTPHMQARQQGVFVNILTFSAFEPDLAFPVSSSLRAGLAGFTKMYADRYAADGIRMNNVLPGFMDSYPESEDILARIPMDRYGRVEELAATVRFLLSDDAGYITGQNLRVDGGLTRSV
ncbi:MAG: SDR family oxidoreductase [Candidatus Promineifilaceae bacterium]|nr:SDR family oxidoreductase [Candidatus Promineifilaceae bacterium]